jgi:bla regulator protein blaR1
LQTHTNTLRSAALFAMLCFAIFDICGQAVATSRAVRQFEIASIKASRPGAVGSLIQLRSHQGGTTAARNVPLRDLILVAYHLEAFQLSGGPGWLNTDRYDFDAKYQGSATLDDIREFLQTFLADRCNLTLSREMKDGPVYSLVLAKGGPKLKRPQPDGFSGIRSGSNGQMVAENVTIATLAEVLSEKVSRTVIDRTGLPGSYGFTLEGTLEEQEPGHDVDREPSLDSAKPSIFTAIQEQLGLKLEAARAPVQYITIQRIDKPSAN